VEKDEDISADVEWRGFVSGEVWQSVIYVQILVDAEALGWLTVAVSCCNRIGVVSTEEAKVHETTEEG